MTPCRLCLKTTSKSLLSLLENDLPDKLKDCISIDVYETTELPATVCPPCLQKLDDYYSFKCMCIESEKTLKEKLHAKQEILHLKQEKCHSEIKIESDYNSDGSSDSDELGDFIFNESSNITVDLTNNVYICEICTSEFSTCVDYLDHQLEHNGQPVFRCEKCNEVFNLREDLVDHDINHKIPCPSCGKLIRKSSKKLHLIMHTDRYKCTKCPGRFNSNAGLNQHFITVHTDIKDHICEHCGKRFSTKTAMKVHRRTHSEERLFNCKLCSYKGRTASSIYIHMSTHAKETCVCEICSKIFKSMRNLNDHLRRVHSKEKKHQCSYCNKKFVDKYMLSIHMRTHTGVRPYKCTLCEKAFIRSDGLKEHMNTHGEREMFSCKRCNKKFASKRGVVRHTCLMAS